MYPNVLNTNTKVRTTVTVTTSSSYFVDDVMLLLWFRIRETLVFARMVCRKLLLGYGMCSAIARYLSARSSPPPSSSSR